MIVSIEGPNLAGKTTQLHELESLLGREGVPYTIIPEYVDYLGDQNLQPERPLASGEQMEAEGRFYIALERLRQQDIAAALDTRGRAHLILTDRTFFTCLAYARLSGNPISAEMFQEYLHSNGFILPDLILFLCIDPESEEYRRRKVERMKRNPGCRGLSYQVKEYEYIYRNRDYESYFRGNVAQRFRNIIFLDTLKTSARDVYDLIREREHTPCRKLTYAKRQKG